MEAVATDGPRLMATAVAKDSHRHFWRSMEKHTADIKKIAGDDQATLTVNRNAQSFEMYVYEIMTNAPRLMAASGDRSNGTLPT